MGPRPNVVAEAGLQTAAIYYYFPSRDDLVEEVMWVGAASVTRHVHEAVAVGKSYSQFWRTLFNDGIERGEFRTNLHVGMSRMVMLGALKLRGLPSGGS